MRLGRRALGVLVTASCALGACAGGAPAKAPPSTTAGSASSSAAARPPARDRLAAALRSIPRPPPVLDALPGEARKRLAARLAALDAERRLSVHSDDSPLVESLPLLHLVSGGTSPRALYALATTSAGSEELSGLLGVEHETGAGTAASARLTIVRELAQRAALDFLRDRAADVQVKGKSAALASRLVLRVALGVGRRELVLAARELLAEIEPTPENRLNFATELARAADPDRAARELAAVQREASPRPPPAALAAAERAIQAARVVTTTSTATDVAAKLALARAWLELGRTEEARAVLEPELTRAKAHLGLAAAFAETQIELASCPDLPPGVGTAPLCAESFLTSPRVRAASALLDAAWQSGVGRDDEAVEVYVALAHVIPWMHRTAFELARGALSPSEASQRVAGLRDKIRETVAVAPRLAGLSLFVETLPSGIAAASAAPRSEADTRALVDRARELGQRDSSRFAQAGVLAVAAALAREQDISALLELVPFEQTTSGLRVPRAALDVWAAASSGTASRMAAARSELASIMSEGRGESLERARLVLSVSEGDALLEGSERSYQLLSRVAGQLLQDSVPPDLAFRAVLDASGALSHGKRSERAEEVVASAASAELPADFDRASSLLQLVRGYKLVLASERAAPPALAKVRADLLALAPSRGAEPAASWFELWGHELEAREKDALCQGKKLPACREASALRRASRRALDTRLGAQSDRKSVV